MYEQYVFSCTYCNYFRGGVSRNTVIIARRYIIMQMPSFRQWAESILFECAHGKAKDTIAIALQNAFDQGRSLGHREGYQDGKDNAWWKEQESSRGGE